MTVHKIHSLDLAGRLTATLLSFCLILSGCTEPPVPPSEPVRIALPQRETAPAETCYADMTFARVDEQLLFSRIAALTARVSAAKDYSSAQEILLQYDAFLQSYRRLGTLQALARIAADRDVTDQAAAADEAWAVAAANKLYDQLTVLTQAILDSPLAESARLTWGDDYIARFCTSQDLSSPELLPLLEKQQALETEADRLLAKETVAVNGAECSRTELGYPEFARLRAEERGAVYLQLLELRREIAAILGFDSYTGYAYRLYGRGYSADDAAAFSRLVKELLVPVYQKLNDSLSGVALTGELPSPSDALALLEKAAPELGGGFAESLSRMQKQSLIDLAAGENKSASIYTINLPSYRLPYIMLNPAGHYTDATTLFHEAGHFNSALHAPSIGFNQPFSYDTAEFHSQGLEMLMLPYYPELFGDQAKLAERLRLRDLLRNVLSGCMEDEFQRFAYSAEKPTVDLLNAEYERLQSEYFGGGNGNLWVTVPHTFVSPFYYFSYGVSAAAALTLWALSLTDRGQALASYHAACKNGVAADFLSAMEEGDLGDPMSRGSLTSVAERLLAYMEE